MNQDTHIAQKKQAHEAWFKHYTQAALPLLITIAAVCLFANAAFILLPWPLKLLIDSAFSYTPAPGFLDQYTQSEELVYFASGFIILIFTAYVAGLLAKNRFVEASLFKMKTIVNRDYYLHILRLPRNIKALHEQEYYHSRLMNEVSAISTLLITTAAHAIDGLSLIIVSLVALLFLNPKIAIFGPVLAGVMLFISMQREKRTYQYTDNVTRSKAQLNHFVSASLKGSHTVQAFNHEAAQDGEYVEVLTSEYRAVITRKYLDTIFFAINGSLIAITVSLIVFIGGRQYFDGDISSGNMLLCIFYLCLMYPASQRLHDFLVAYAETKASSALVFDDIYDLPEQITTTSKPVPIQAARGLIEYENVNVNFGKKALLRGVNLTVQPGQHVAIIGPKDSGKSTLLCLPPRISTWQSGTVKLDGVDVQEYDINALREQFSYVEQDPTIFTDTIYENVIFGKTNGKANYAEATAALGAARSYDFVKQLPKGFETIIGEGGKQLNGTQMQGIAIARAFLKNAPILLLDEPLSVIDPTDTKAAIDSLSELMKGKTVLLVSRNIDLLKSMDAVYVIEEEMLRNVTEYGGLDAYHDVLLSLSSS